MVDQTEPHHILQHRSKPDVSGGRPTRHQYQRPREPCEHRGVQHRTSIQDVVMSIFK